MGQLQNPITVEQYTEIGQVADVTWKIAIDREAQKLAQVRSLFTEESTDLLAENVGEGPSGSGFAGQYDELDDAPLSSVTPGDTMTTEQRSYGFRIKLSEKLLHFGNKRYPLITREIEGRAKELMNGYNLDATHKFTFCNSSAYNDRSNKSVSVVGANGVSLVNDAQTTNSGSSYDNLLGSGSSYRLSDSTLTDAEELGNGVTDHNGLPSHSLYSTLVTSNHRPTVKVAERLINQNGEVSIQISTDTVLNDMNTHKGKYRHVILPYLDTLASGEKDSTKARYWFIIDDEVMRGNLISVVGKSPSLASPVDAENAFITTLKGNMYYDIYHLNSRGIVGVLAS